MIAPSRRNLAKLHVEVFNTKQGKVMFDTKVGDYGKQYPLSFVNFISLIRGRMGHEQPRLEYKA